MSRKPQAVSPEQVEEIRNAVFAVAEPLLAEKFFLLDVAFEKEAGQWFLRLYIEGRDFRVSLNDCADASRLVEPALENLPALGDLSYNLEVSSPGLFRALRTDREFKYYAGRPVKVEILGEKKPREGILEKYDNVAKTLYLRPAPSTKPNGDKASPEESAGTGTEELIAVPLTDATVMLNPELKPVETNKT